LWGLEHSGSKNNFTTAIFSPSEYCGKWFVLVRDIKKQPKVLEILLELVVERQAKDMMEDLDDAGVPLEEYSDDEEDGAADT
jgi:hypothetical protein